MKLQRILRATLFEPWFWIALALLALGCFLDSLASYVTITAGSLPVLPDKILDSLPFFAVPWLYDLLSLAILLILFWRLGEQAPEDLPLVLFLLALLQFVRAAMIFINPIAPPANSPYGLIELWGASPDYHQGAIPSGHTMFAAFTAFFLRGRYRLVVALLSVAMIATLFLARAHYTVDIVVGFLIGYAIYRFGEAVVRPWLAKRLSQ